MEIEFSDNLKNVDPELLSIIFQNPFLSHPEDEIGETALVKWITKEYKSQTGTTVSKQDVYGLITKLMLEEILLGKRYGKKLLLKPTRNYYLLKSGQPMVQKKKVKTQISLFADDKGYLVTDNAVTSQENEITDTAPENLGEEHSQCHTSIKGNLSYYDLLLEKISDYNGPDKELVRYFQHSLIWLVTF